MANNTPEDREARVEIIAAHFQEILETLGETPREGIEGTPQRFARMYMDEIYCSGDPLEEELSTVFVEPTRAREMIVLRDLPIISYCEHHTLPYFGKAHVGYIPRNNIIGLSKVARLVIAASRGLTIQERVTDRVADALVKVLNPIGVAVVTDCVHTCMVVRGVKSYTASTTISAIRGLFMENEAARAEFFAMVKR